MCAYLAVHRVNNKTCNMRVQDELITSWMKEEAMCLAVSPSGGVSYEVVAFT